MKKILGCALALFSSLAIGATLNPIQLLNPAGSTAGQVISSTGATTAPVWGGVTLGSVTGTLAITNGGTGSSSQSGALANILGSSAVPVANGGTGATNAAAALTNLGAAPIASPSLTGVPLAPTAAISTYTDQIATTKFVLNQASSTTPLINGTAAVGTSASFARADHVHPTDTTRAAVAGNLSQFASTTSAQLATLLSDETGSGSAVFSLTPTLTAPNIVGTISGGNAAAGSVGEYLTATTASTAATSGTPLNSTSISLTAGDWDVQGSFDILPAGTTTVSGFLGSLSTTSATHNATLGNLFALQGASFSAGQSQYFQTPVTRISVASTTTVYLVVSATFAVSTCNVGGLIRARRVR